MRWIGAIAVLFITIMLVIAIPLSIKADDGTDQTDSSPWPMFRGNAQRTGLSSYSTSENPGSLKWRLFIPDYDCSPPVILPNGSIIINGKRGLWFIGKEGNILGTFKSTEPWTRHYSPAIGKNVTILVPKGNSIFAVDSHGSIEWEFTSDSKVKSPAVDAQGIIYFSSDRTIYSLDYSGNLRWSHNTSSWASPPSVDQNDCVYIGSANELFSFTSNGSTRWSFKADGTIYPTPAISSEGMVFFSTESDTLYAIDDGGNLVWSLEIGSSISGSPAIDSDGSIYITVDKGDDGGLYKISRSGKIEWEFPCGWLTESPVVSRNGDVIFFDGWNVYSIDNNGNRNWKYPVTITGRGGNDLAIDEEGTVYLMTDFGNTLYAINSRPLYLSVFAMIAIAFLGLFIPLILINSRLSRTDDRSRRGPILLLYAGGFLLLINCIFFVVLNNYDEDFLFSLGYEPWSEINMFFWLIMGMVLVLLGLLSTSDGKNSATYGVVSVLCAVIAFLTMGGFLVGPFCALMGGLLLISEGSGTKSAAPALHEETEEMVS